MQRLQKFGNHRHAQAALVPSPGRLMPAPLVLTEPGGSATMPVLLKQQRDAAARRAFS